MKTYREYISQVKDLVREINADSRLTNKQVYSLLLKHAQWLIFRDSDKLKLLSKNTIFKEIPCIKVQEAPLIECSEIELDCTVYRTVKKLPKLFEDSSGVIISSITSVDSFTDIKLVSVKELKRKMNNPWKKKNRTKTIYAYYKNGYIYFPEEKLNMINVTGFFSEPIEKISDCDEPCRDCKKPCDKFLDETAPIPDYLSSQVIDFVLRDLTNTYEKIPERSHEINKNFNSPS